MDSSLVPKLTRPTTAYALLSKICKLITEEPKRYNQGQWIALSSSWIGMSQQWMNAAFPACGTVCCVAGWVESLRTSPQVVKHLDDDSRYTSDVSDAARRTLGLSEKDAAGLFRGDALVLLVGDDVPVQGTSEYAALGVKHIRAFQKKHAKKLKAKIVRPERAKGK